jgi:hypothetical protein
MTAAAAVQPHRRPILRFRGLVIVIPQEDCWNGVGDLTLRVLEVGGGLRHRNVEWVGVHGIPILADQPRGRARSVLVRATTLRALLQQAAARRLST